MPGLERVSASVKSSGLWDPEARSEHAGRLQVTGDDRVVPRAIPRLRGYWTLRGGPEEPPWVSGRVPATAGRTRGSDRSLVRRREVPTPARVSRPRPARRLLCIFAIFPIPVLHSPEAHSSSSRRAPAQFLLPVRSL